MSTKLALTTAIAVALVGCGGSSDDHTEMVKIDLRLMETTDLHGNMMPYNYFSNTGQQDYGFARTAPVIRQVREEVTNSMLFDNGDLIQGSPMADYMANLGVDYIAQNRHAVYKAMNLLDYDAANIGNHEFNYGLEYLNAAIQGANFPYVVANVFKYDETLVTPDSFDSQSCEPRIDAEFLQQAEPAFEPYRILDRDFIADDGKTYSVKVGVIGFTPPNIISWDKKHLECEVLVSDIKTTAAYYVEKMKQDGADVIVAISHTGLTGGDTDVPFMDNATWQIANIDGIDAVMFGHDHNNFPTTSNSYDGMEGVDAPAGKIFGKPAVMPGYWGNHVGVIDLVLETKDEGQSWSVNHESSRTELRSLFEDKSIVASDVVQAVQDDHDGTVEFMQTPILQIEQKVNSFFSAIEPDLSVQIVNEAQFNWGKKITTDGTLEMETGGILLSVSAPFKGGRGGALDYTNIDGTELTNASVADLYVFDNNTPAVLKLTVADVKEWLETIASQQYQTVANDGDYLLHQMFRSYNFDVFYGGWDAEGNSVALNYTIDVSQPPRYLVDNNGELINGPDNLPQLNPEGDFRRISDISYGGEVLADSQVVYVVTNNYRASNNWIPGVDNAELVYEDGAYSNRELVDQYLNELAESYPEEVPLHRFENAQNFSLIGLAAGIKVKFLSSPEGEGFAQDLQAITFTDEVGDVGDNTGFRVYTFTFN
ncbi:bifunctional 2',3'-cyclic-nucleotide 2'-phosphodiesterase/3'-nucleotidase [Vibrio sp. EA2]|uniref:bifunctional 2',3'-cyclic-nucleotide 2'-phosphodiesterase/3'-nucleotidase n=1 Tax=Vibrio sp. EA2 TaxID=3079860 RepID=UPI002948F0CE|nr:bifunctional 2',3'-cyclic-nucleotide 2'-phosphodiesterase/3'-nucleotidase [Vibrio sp. EA2]MDV6249745.1 bifunctional 2',3'-cyclic-nucleotide 2'-phosphodiesterase/3'-nucleotidase [Vibrio sp. EA2]